MIKLPFIILGLLIFVTPVHAQDGLTDGERIARLEGAYEHLATKADVEALHTKIAEVRTEVESVRTEVETVRTDISRLESKIEGFGSAMWIGVAIATLMVSGISALASWFFNKE